MEGPFEWIWTHADNPTDRFELVEWHKHSEHERVGLRPLGKAAQRQQRMRWAHIDDVKPADPKAPNFLEGVKILRDFKRYELDHVRKEVGVADFFEALTVELDWLGSTTSDGSGPDERARYQQHARYKSVARCGHALSTFSEELRDAKACELALEQDIMAYPHVPLIHRTDKRDDEFRKAKRTKLAAYAAAAEAMAKKEAAAERRRPRDAETHKKAKPNASR